jgi:hypothetical protein
MAGRTIHVGKREWLEQNTNSGKWEWLEQNTHLGKAAFYLQALKWKSLCATTCS